MGATRDWVVLYFDGTDGERQSTVITSRLGRLAGLRIVRGRELECERHHRRTAPRRRPPAKADAGGPGLPRCARAGFAGGRSPSPRGSRMLQAIEPPDAERLIVADSPEEAADRIHRLVTSRVGLRWQRRPSWLPGERGVSSGRSRVSG